MKKFGYLCVLFLFVPEVTHTSIHSEDVLYGVIGGGCIFSLMTHLWHTRNSAKYQFKAEQAAIERERIDAQQKAETEKFHLIEKVTALEKLFDQVIAETEQKKSNADEIFYNKMIGYAGSISAFKKQLESYEQGYDKLSPDHAKENEAVMATIRTIKAQLYSNLYVAKMEKIELEENLAIRAREAQIKKTESEARLTQEAEYCIQKAIGCVQKAEEIIARVKSNAISIHKKIDKKIEALQSSQSQHAMEQKYCLANLELIRKFPHV